MSDQEENMSLIWEKLTTYAEDSLGDKIGQGIHDFPLDDEYADEWADICLAMAQIREGLGLCDEVDLPANIMDKG